MPERSRKPKKLPSDENKRAKKIVDALTAPERRAEPKPPPGAKYAPPKNSPTTPEPEKNPAAVALGKLGGAKGGPARAKALSKKRRAEIAKKAATARWGKTKTT
jgi:hypothetical protein